jgi:hypothetical protein
LHSRTVRTNIAFPASNNGNNGNNNFSKADFSEVEAECPEVFKEMYYQANAFADTVKNQAP